MAMPLHEKARFLMASDYGQPTGNEVTTFAHSSETKFNVPPMVHGGVRQGAGQLVMYAGSRLG